MPELGAFSRTLPVLSLVILVSFGIVFLSVAYNLAAFSPQEFVQQPEAREYENEIVELSAMDEWSRTQLYWSNNLGVAGLYAALFPTYLSLASDMANSYAIGIPIAYYNAEGGWRYALAFSAELFVHGILELTGIFIITAATFRLAWKFWSGIGHIGVLSLEEPTWGMVWKKVLRRKRKIKLEVSDFSILFVVGMLMIFWAGPVESYISPVAVAVFLAEPLVAVLFLGVVAYFYLSLASLGFRRMLQNLRGVWGDVRLGLSGKFRPSQVPVLMLAVLLSALLLRLVFA